MSVLELQERSNPLIEAPLADEEADDGWGPDWLRKLRRDHAARFAEAGIPTTRHEEWKYTSLRGLADARFESARFEAEPASISVSGDLPLGTICCSFREAVERHEALVRKHLGTVATLEGCLGSFNDERFVWLNTANLSDGAFVFVPKGATAEPLIRLDFTASNPARLLHPRVLIVLEEGAGARVLETYSGKASDYLRNPVTEVSVGKGASLEHVRMQSESESAFHLGTLAVRQEAESNFASTVVSFGGRIARLDVQAWVGGEHCETTLNGIYVAGGEQLVDHHTRIDHAVPNCHSFEVYKGILGGKATGVFNGKIFVYEDAQKTDAKQTNQAMLLSKTAAINTKPQLEIFADDVKCTHGATVGQLREDALFYLRSRGVPEQEAKSILVFGFAAEVLEKIEVDEVRKLTEDGLYEKLAAIQAGGD